MFDNVDNLPVFMDIVSQNELHAFSSMIIANMPYPPLPVVVLNDETQSESMASSHDIWQRAIIADYINQTTKEHDKTLELKKNILNELMYAMQTFVVNLTLDERHNKKMHETNIAKVYEIFCASFRNYFLQFYSNTSQDLRFYSMHHVAATDKVVAQAQSHLKASFLLHSETDKCLSNNYKDIISMYAFELGDFDDVDK